MEPLCSKEFLCRRSGRDSCILPSQCMLPSLRSAPSVNLPPFYVPVSPVAHAPRFKPCPVALVPTLGCSRPPARNLHLLRSALSGRIIPEYIFVLKPKRSFTLRGHVQLSRKKRSTASPRRFRSCLDERWPARRESAGFPLSVPMPTSPRRDPGPKRPRVARPRTPD